MNFGEEDEEVAPIIAKRRHKPINRKTKIQVVFDEKSRRDFLTGFHKRKLNRKKRAQDELKEQLKEEKKRIKQESKEQYKKLTKSYQPIPELEKKLAEYHEVKNATVSILELDTDLLAENNFIIGRNRIKCEDANENDTTVEIKKKIDDSSPFENGEKNLSETKTKKELKREIKKKATQIVKKSSAFQKLNRQEQIRQRKKSIKKKNLKLKKLDKVNRKRNKKKFASS